jgi:hypothetical protein
MENARLRFIVREVKYVSEDLKDEEQLASHDEDSPNSGCGGSPCTAAPRTHDQHHQFTLAKETITKLDELLQEADAVITSLRAQNEELLRQNETMRQRERRDVAHHQHATNSDDTMSEPVSDVLNNMDVNKADDETLAAYVGRVKEQLRIEKRQRLEAEELSHKLLIEHQKNVHLLEQRLMQRNMVGTPRSGTPRKTSASCRSLLSVTAQPGQQPHNTGGGGSGAFEPQYSQASSSLVGASSTVSQHAQHGRVESHQNLEEEAALLLSDAPSVPSPQHHRDTSSEMLVDGASSPDVVRPGYTTSQRSDGGDDGGDDPMMELQSIEAQLNEVVASLEEA